MQQQQRQRNELVREIEKELVDLKTKVSYDAMSVLFRRYELAKPSSRLIYEGDWMTTFVSTPRFMYKVVATTPHGKLLSIYGTLLFKLLLPHLHIII